ncbi:MAG: hypothetical protein MJ071_05620 [Oscillospiraceae bacterium]|nr:hypothetical protein [Oscillospiraceae bacterium]
MIHVHIRDRTAFCGKSDYIVCGNTNQQMLISFDEEWNDIRQKQAILYPVGKGKPICAVTFEGNVCALPLLSDVREISIEITGGNLCTAVPFRVPCLLSVLDAPSKPASDTEDIYNIFMEQLARHKSPKQSLLLCDSSGYLLMDSLGQLLETEEVYA